MIISWLFLGVGAVGVYIGIDSATVIGCLVMSKLYELSEDIKENKS